LVLYFWSPNTWYHAVDSAIIFFILLDAMTTKNHTKTSIKPLGDRVLVREILETAQKTKSGIYIPDTANADKGMKRGEVVTLGDGRYEDGKRVPMQVKKGDTVLYTWGEKIEVDGVEYVLVRESEISAVIA
jgi:chaperonin GroES